MIRKTLRYCFWQDMEDDDTQLNVDKYGYLML